jgi:hypothetical protein
MSTQFGFGVLFARLVLLSHTLFSAIDIWYKIASIFVIKLAKELFSFDLYFCVAEII